MGNSFENFYAQIPKDLQFYVTNYFKKSNCDKFSSSSVMVMGFNGNDKCVYWNYNDNPSKYECLNDGTVTKSDWGRCDKDEKTCARRAEEE